MTHDSDVSRLLLPPARAMSVGSTRPSSTASTCGSSEAKGGVAPSTRGKFPHEICQQLLNALNKFDTSKIFSQVSEEQNRLF